MTRTFAALIHSLAIVTVTDGDDNIAFGLIRNLANSSLYDYKNTAAPTHSRAQKQIWSGLYPLARALPQSLALA